MKLTPSESHRFKPASLPWLYWAIVRLRLRMGPKQVELLLEETK